MPCSLVFWLDENFCNNPNCLVLTPTPVRQKLDPLQCNIREPTHRKQVRLNIVQWPTIIESYVGETYTLRNSIYKVTNRALFYAYCSAWLTTNFIRVDNCPFPCVPVRVAATDIDFSDLKKKKNAQNSLAISCKWTKIHTNCTRSLSPPTAATVR